jgi:hypothetical protein
LLPRWEYTLAVPEQDDYMPKMVFERMVSPEDVGGEAGERLKYLREANSERGLSDEELAEKNRIITAHTGAAGVVEAPDLDMLGVADFEAFRERFSAIHEQAEAAYQDGWFLEAISLRMLTLDFLLRMYIVHKTKQPVRGKPTFGQLIKKAKGQNFRQSLATDLEAYNDRRNEGIHNYLLGQGSYQDLGNAYRDADGLFERVFEAMGLPPFKGA